jgi:hypothetical protein
MADRKTDAGVPELADPFDPAALRISGDAEISTEKVLTAVPVRKPKKDEFFVERESDLDRQVYVVVPSCADALPEVIRRSRLFTCISRRGTMFLWPARLPSESGSGSGQRWAETALKIAEQAESLWVRMWGDLDLGGYAMIRAKGNLAEPKWPDKTFAELLRIAFESRIVDRPDHDLIRELNGEL